MNRIIEHLAKAKVCPDCGLFMAADGNCKNCAKKGKPKTDKKECKDGKDTKKEDKSKKEDKPKKDSKENNKENFFEKMKAAKEKKKASTDNRIITRMANVGQDNFIENPAEYCINCEYSCEEKIEKNSEKYNELLKEIKELGIEEDCPQTIFEITQAINKHNENLISRTHAKLYVEDYFNDDEYINEEDEMCIIMINDFNSEYPKWDEEIKLQYMEYAIEEHNAAIVSFDDNKLYASKNRIIEHLAKAKVCPDCGLFMAADGNCKNCAKKGKPKADKKEDKKECKDGKDCKDEKCCKDTKKEDKSKKEDKPKKDSKEENKENFFEKMKDAKEKKKKKASTDNRIIMRIAEFSNTEEPEQE